MIDAEFESYLLGLSDHQATSLRELRRLITENSEGLEEAVTTGRWLSGFIFYSAAGQMIYAIGPKGKTKTSFHMMPYYGSPALQERNRDALAPLLTGKSCIAFRSFADVPVEAVTDIIRTGTPVMIQMLEDRAAAGNGRRA